MTRRILAVVALATALTITNAVNASATIPEVSSSGGAGVCVDEATTDIGVCVTNPFPSIIRIVEGVVAAIP